MGAVTTPDGRIIYVPDAMGMAPPPVDASLAGAPNAAPALGQAAPQQSIFDMLPPSVLQNITGQAPQPPSPTATPSPETPVQSSPDYTVTPKVEAKTGPALQKANKQYGAQQAAQQAYAASPEGKIDAATRTQEDALAAQGDVAQAVGEVQAQEGDEKRAILEDRNVDLQRQQMDIEETQKQREKRLGELKTNHDKLVQAEASYKVDRGRMWANKGTGSKVLAGIAVAMTALGDALQGKSGPNLALQIITDAIDDDVNDQVREFEQLGTKVNRARSSLDSYMKETGDIVASKQMLQAQRRLQAADMLEASAARFENPKAKLNAMNNAAELRLKAGALSGQSAEGRFARDVQREQIANAKAQVGLGYANLKQRQLESKRDFDEGVRQFDRKMLLEAAQLDQSGNAAGAKAAREQVQQVKQLGIGGNVVQTVGPDGKPTVSYDIMRTKDGQPFLAPTEKEAVENRAQKAAVDSINQFANDMVRGIKEHGGENAFFKSEAWQQMQSKKAFIMNNLRVANKMGTLDEGAMKVTEAMLGAADPSSYWQDASKGILTGRDASLAQFNSTIRSQGYDGPDYKPPDVAQPGEATSSVADVAQKEALTPLRAQDTPEGSAAHIVQTLGGTPEGLIGGMTEPQKHGLDTIFALSRSDDPAVAAENGKRLEVVASSPTADPAVKEYAARMLQLNAERTGSARASRAAPAAKNYVTDTIRSTAQQKK